MAHKAVGIRHGEHCKHYWNVSNVVSRFNAHIVFYGNFWARGFATGSRLTSCSVFRQTACSALVASVTKKRHLTRTELKRQFHKLAIAQSDILNARAACRYFVEHVSDIAHTIYYPLFVTIVICYARPFTDNDTFGRLAKKWGTFSNQRLQRSHDLMLKTRNEVVAHSDAAIRQIRIVPAGVTYPFTFTAKKPVISQSYGFMITTYVLEPRHFTDALDTICDVLDRLQPEVSRLFDLLYKYETLPPRTFPLTIDETIYPPSA